MSKNKFESRRVKVTDNWYPCFEGNQIGISIHLIYYSHNKTYNILIVAYGADDFDVELRRVTKSYEKALSIYKNWKRRIFNRVPDGITKQWFYERGFM